MPWYVAVVFAMVQEHMCVLVIDDQWRVALPKGGCQHCNFEEGRWESPYETALRKLSEETGLVDLRRDWVHTLETGWKHAWFDAKGMETTAGLLEKQGKSGWLCFRWDKAPDHVLTYELRGKDAHNNPRFVRVAPNPLTHEQQQKCFPWIVSQSRLFS